MPPVISCQWLAPGGAIVTVPLVIDLDGDGKSEVVFFETVRESALHDVFHAIHSDCSEYFSIQLSGNLNFANHSLAAADLDGDGVPELIALLGNEPGHPTISTFVTVFDNHGKQLAQADSPYFVDFDGADASAPAVADIDGDGVPEIVASAQVLRYKKGQGHLQQLWNNPPRSNQFFPSWGETMSLFADLDGDGKQEVVTGKMVYDGLTGADKTPSELHIGGVSVLPQVADFNGDSKPDILLVGLSGDELHVKIVDYTNNKVIFGQYTQSVTYPSPAVVADFDSDGVPDFGLSTAEFFFAYSLKCIASNKPADCLGSVPGVLWQRDTGALVLGGPSAFDFNGDGQVELVEHDRCWLRAMNGADGKTVFASPLGGTGAIPVVADVDNDGHADLVVAGGGSRTLAGAPDPVPCPAEVPGGSLSNARSPTGVFILKDPLNRWMPARSIWNQHTYHVTNINDDGTVPKRETPNWSSSNNFRQQSGGTVAMGKADFTARTAAVPTDPDSTCTQDAGLRAELCNRGGVASAAGVAGTFYDGDPRIAGSHVLCSANTTKVLSSGECEEISCQWINPSQSSIPVWFRANDRGDGTSVPAECDSENNLLIETILPCVTRGPG